MFIRPDRSGCSEVGVDSNDKHFKIFMIKNFIGPEADAVEWFWNRMKSTLIFMIKCLLGQKRMQWRCVWTLDSKYL